MDQIESNCRGQINPLHNMPILGSSNSAAKKDVLSDIKTNGDIIF